MHNKYIDQSEFRTVTQFCELHPAFKLGGMRSLIFNASSNGLSTSGAIVRLGRKVMIIENKFFLWIEAQNGGKK